MTTYSVICFFIQMVSNLALWFQAVSCDEAFLDVTGIEDPETLASTMRKEIFDMTRCTASVGIAENLLLARLATRKAKPDGQYRIATEEVQKLVILFYK